MTNTEYRFPFGCPVTERKPSAYPQGRLFVLGAYPSALHVQWEPPVGRPGGLIKAMAVDNEPEPFWNGADADEQVAKWLRDAEFHDGWGVVKIPPGINGRSGGWVDSNILKKFDALRTDAWITDCLNAYRRSEGGWRAIEERFVPFAVDAGIELPELAPHPDEDQIVAEASTAARSAALRDELHTAAPETIVTLGNSALRVMRELVDEIVGPDPGKGLRVGGYGARCDVLVNGRTIGWYPLAHPAAPERYQVAHEGWMPA